MTPRAAMRRDQAYYRRTINALFKRHFDMMTNTFIRHFTPNYQGRWWDWQLLRRELWARDGELADCFNQWRLHCRYTHQPYYDFHQTWVLALDELDPILAEWELNDWVNRVALGQESELLAESGT